MAFTPKKAVRTARRLKIAITGPTGGGKTLAALCLASVLCGDRRFLVADTEAGRAALYADDFDFDHGTIEAPFHTDKYIEAIRVAMDGDYGALVLDSLSHQWDGEGGMLQRKTAKDAQGGNHFTNWAPFSTEFNKFREAVQQAPIPIISTIRSKLSYATTEGGGKAAPKKIGMQPIQRDTFEYEFDLVFDVQMTHRATIAKGIRGLLPEGDGMVYDLADPAIGRQIVAWLASAPDQSEPGPTPRQRARFAQIIAAEVWNDEDRDTFSKAETRILTQKEYQSMLDDLIALGTARKVADPGASA